MLIWSWLMMSSTMLPLPPALVPPKRTTCSSLPPTSCSTAFLRKKTCTSYASWSFWSLSSNLNIVLEYSCLVDLNTFQKKNLLSELTWQVCDPWTVAHHILGSEEKTRYYRIPPIIGFPPLSPPRVQSPPCERRWSSKAHRPNEHPPNHCLDAIWIVNTTHHKAIEHIENATVVGKT